MNNKAISNNDKYVIGVSGGPDSMALLDKYKAQIIAVCHVNYNMRPTANRDEKIVIDYCNQNNIKYYVLKVDSKNKVKNNFQSWAREIRYDYMCKIAKEYSAKGILIGHHLNDFLETAIMQIQKEKMTLFLGIKYHSKYKGVDIYRPFINIWKKDIYKYCEKNQILFGIDETNESLKYERNLIRSEIAKWNNDEINFFLKKIINFNNSNKLKYEKVLSVYEEWKKSFNVDFLLKEKIDIVFHVMYEFFMENNLKFNMNKFKAILILMHKNNPTKCFRLGNDKILVVKNRILLID